MSQVMQDHVFDSVAKSFDQITASRIVNHLVRQQCAIVPIKNDVYQGITTKFIGPTNTRGSRVKATAEAGSITLSWDHALASCANHRAAAEALATKLDWQGVMSGGSIGEGYAWVFATRF